jgi:hypothetical protein
MVEEAKAMFINTDISNNSQVNTIERVVGASLAKRFKPIATTMQINM